MKLIDSVLYRKDLGKALTNINLKEFEGKKVFITGGLGLVCSAVVDVLLAYGKIGKIYVGDRNEDLFRMRYCDYDNVEYIQYDALLPLNISCSPDYIICGAGLASPELYVSMPVETVLSNFEGILNLLRFACDNRSVVKKLLYISSSEVYGNKDIANAFVEGTYGNIDIDNIRSSYAIGKRASEMICKAYASECGIDVMIVRPGHIYGPSANNKDKRISSDFTYKAARGENFIMKSSGTQKRSYCYSVDCAIQILTVLLRGKSGQAYNIGHDEVTTIRKMAEIIAKAGNVDLDVAEPTKEELTSFNPMNNSSLDNSKVKALGYRDTFSVEEGLTHTVQILREIM